MVGKRQALLHHQVFLVSENSAAKQKNPLILYFIIVRERVISASIAARGLKF